jgi:hypothetical protein
MEMNRPTWTPAALTALLGGGGLVMGAAAAQAGKAPARPSAPPPKAVQKIAPKEIWPAGLKELAGRYQFVQVASPGGLWRRMSATDVRQVSLWELPPATRARFEKAELIISDLEPSDLPDAREEISPSKRGRIRYYSENAVGKLTMRNLPGIGGDDEDKGTFAGKVEFALTHQSHSNPSVSGILFQRMQQESTWGAATIDYADLEAAQLTDGKPKPGPRPLPGRVTPRSTTQRPDASGVILASAVTPATEMEAIQPVAQKVPAPAKPGGAKPAPSRPANPSHEEDDGPPPVIANARVLRSGIEIIVFTKWQEPVNGKMASYTGSVRLVKMDQFRRLQQRLGSPSPAPLVP